MKRLQLIQSLIDKRKYKTYLEIGVRRGKVFFKVACLNKVAVDPEYSFGWKEKIKRSLSTLRGRKFYDLTSDDFFDQYADKLFSENKVDIVLVDGMHEFEFALRDILNSLKYLSDHGVIIVHDCNPLSKEATCSFKEYEQRGFTGTWNGDVWKSIYYLQENRKDLEVFVADTDHGLGIISKRNNQPIVEPHQSVKEIKSMPYEDLDKNRNAFLNLKPMSALYEL